MIVIATLRIVALALVCMIGVSEFGTARGVLLMALAYLFMPSVNVRSK